MPETVFSSRLTGAAMALGLPPQSAQRNLGLQFMVVVCSKMRLRAPTAATRYAPFSVIVPVNRPLGMGMACLLHCIERAFIESGRTP